MSQHTVEVEFANPCKNFTLVMGYDRPTNDSFWWIHPIGSRPYGSATDPDLTLSSAIAKMGLDLETTTPLWETVGKMTDAIYDEAVANDQSLAVQELMSLIQEGVPLEEAQAKVRKLQEFKDFNRIVNYPEVVLN